jgi:hypothetical protein
MLLGIMFHPEQRDCLAGQITGIGSAIFVGFSRTIVPSEARKEFLPSPE